MSAIIENLRSNQEFMKYLEWVRSQRPVIPEYDHTKDNTEEWKALSQMARGFDLCLTYFGEKP